MTSPRFRVAVVSLAFSLVLATSTAEAAKGVKKNTPANGQQIMSGIVTKIIPDGTGGGTFHVKTAIARRTMGSGVVAGGDKVRTGEFNVNGTTRFEHYNGYGISVANAAALRTGARVRVQSTGQQAQRVQIVTISRSSGNFSRHRANNYHPHVHHRHR